MSTPHCALLWSTVDFTFYHGSTVIRFTVPQSYRKTFTVTEVNIAVTVVLPSFPRPCLFLISMTTTERQQSLLLLRTRLSSAWLCCTPSRGLRRSTSTPGSHACLQIHHGTESVLSDVTHTIHHRQRHDAHTHTLRFNGHFSRWTWVSQLPP